MNLYPTEERMADQTSTDFILLFRGGISHNDLSPEQMQQILAQYTEWIDRHRERGQYLGGKPLENQGKVVSGKSEQQIVSDGPFMESKEIVAGFTMFRAASLEAAVEIAKDCPFLGSGGIVEVRPVASGQPCVER
jgi:hypothetical protein